MMTKLKAARRAGPNERRRRRTGRGGDVYGGSADGLSQIVELWRERGGQVFFFTATPYRGDGRPVRLEAMRAFRRSLAEHMAEGFAPRHLESEIVALGKPDGTASAMWPCVGPAFEIEVAGTA